VKLKSATCRAPVHLTAPNIAQYRAEFKTVVNTAISKQQQDLTYLQYQEIFAVDTASLKEHIVNNYKSLESSVQKVEYSE